MSYKLLLIEDDEIFTFLLKKALKKVDFPSITDVFINGLAAYKITLIFMPHLTNKI